MKKDREKQFPEIEDFSMPFDKYKDKNVNDLTHRQWLWFHPSAYHLITIGSNVIGSVLYIGGGLYIVSRIPILGLVMIGIGAYLTYKGWKAIQEREENKRTTLYDIYLRDY